MDPASLASSVACFLAPFLPELLGKGAAAIGRGAKQTWEKVEILWQVLRERIEQKEAANEACNDVADSPEDREAIAAMALQLRKLLEGSEQLRGEVTRLLAEAEAAAQSEGVKQVVRGDRNIQVGGNVTGSKLSTGDRK
ncbi:hypothetical protein [Tautonia rosea]|uniref:hypothetical protein n=1 Tax=Tautonia rosea TaxID=2728037 RepID=UPI0014727CD3|nr:hypothetical protein [Tautonia rosea]